MLRKDLLSAHNCNVVFSLFASIFIYEYNYLKIVFISKTNIEARCLKASCLFYYKLPLRSVKI